MHARSPTFDSALAALRALRTAKIGISDKILGEIERRIIRLEHLAHSVIELNNALIDSRVPKGTFDPQTDTLTVTLGGVSQQIRIPRAYPDRPVVIGGTSAGGDYFADSPARPTDPLELEFEQRLESYYQNAHRVLKLVQQLPGLKRFVCQPITRVRNDLIEHPKGPDGYSFGFGMLGPTVRPIHSANRKFLDPGLVPNTEAFVIALKDGFERVASEKASTGVGS